MSPAGPAGAGEALCVWLGTLASWRQGLIMRLVRECGSVGEALDRSPEELAALAAPRRGGAAGPRPHAGPRRDPSGPGRAAGDATDAARFADVLAAGPEACLRAVRRRPAGHRVVAWSDPLYPAQLRKLTDPPLCLFVRGADDDAVEAGLSALAHVPAVAVVGTRAPSPYGEEMARLLGRDLTRAGLIVVSGMALGIDAAAQAAALEAAAAGRPATVAVLGCGADVAYPRRHARLYAAIVAAGLVVSEFVWGVPARPWRFPARNRVMAALARGVVLVEGTERSGAKITAGFAADLGREVLCVPGEAGRRLSAAPHQFLRDGAKLCESAADVVRGIAADAPAGPVEAEALAPDQAAFRLEQAVILDHGEGAVRDVLRALESGAMTIDELSRRCALTAAKAAAAVTELEIDGLARRVDGGRYRLQRR